MRAALIALAACGSAAPSPKQPPKQETAADVLAAMAATYAKAKTYTDTGYVTRGHGDTDRRVVATRSFEASFVRGARFRFEIRDENDPQRGFVVWADPTHTFSRWYGPPRTTDDGPQLATAIAVATKPSFGVAALLAGLLRPDAVTPPALADAHIAGTEAIDDHPCWVVTGTRGGDPITLWIDRASHLLRQSREPAGEETDVALYHPALDPQLAAAQVPEPDFSDDYADDSQAMTDIRALVGKPAIAFDAPVVSGQGSASIAGNSGKVVVVDFWATWCGPCGRTLPRINAWHHKYADRGLRIIGLSSEDEDDIKPFVAEHHLDYLIGQDKDGATAKAYKAAAIPMLVVIDKAGVVRYVTLGAGNLDAVEAVIESLLR